MENTQDNLLIKGDQMEETMNDEIMGLENTVTPEDADTLGAFEEDALSEEDAKNGIEMEA